LAFEQRFEIMKHGGAVYLKPKEPRPIPKETGEIGAKILPIASVYKLVGDEQFNWFSEAERSDESAAGNDQCGDFYFVN
jgi:hypothetical protein